ncbi:MAG TPA: hypothetical protein VK043_06865 [Burkholderiales bacterium]|nr:hypothetical protein [Burkholderiales bacterium]
MKSVSALLELIPERTTRSPSGSRLPVPPEGTGDGRLAFLAQQLNWLTPFNALNAEGQRILGLGALRERPEREEDDGEGEEDPLAR